MNAAEDLARLVDPPRGTGAYGIDGAAAGAVDTGKAEQVNGHAAFPPRRQPRFLRRRTLLLAPSRRLERGCLIHPGAAVIAIDARRRKIPDPLKTGHQC